MFTVPLSIYEGRIQEMWTELDHSGHSIFSDHTSILFALLDAGIAQDKSETHRSESTTLLGSEEKLKSQLAGLERRMKCVGESFLFVPLEEARDNQVHAHCHVG